jgi:putative oxidoreductase
LEFARLVLSEVIITKLLNAKIAEWLAPERSFLQSVLLLVIRLYWGWGFFQTGKGKLMDIEKPTEFFQSLGIPFPHTQAILVGMTECVGGLLLLLGLASRVISIPLTILLVVAYLTADLEIAKNIFNNPDKFLAADEFLFLFAVVLVLVFGPGKFSIDWIVRRKIGPAAAELSPAERSPEEQRCNSLWRQAIKVSR